ncbi:MAG: hypothetical protein IJO59_02880, partial [Clostridia bacterium]|nr:hypothetical protein [Clostridia bacterium]
MKRFLASLSAVVLLVSVLLVGAAPVMASGEKPVPFFYSYATLDDFNANVGTALPDQDALDEAEELPENIVETGRADVSYTHRTFGYEWGANAAGNTELAFDAELGALKVMAKEDFTGNKADYPGVDFNNSMTNIHQVGKINILPDNDVSAKMTDYPVFAMKVKLANMDYTFGTGNTLIARNGTSAGGFAAIASSEGYVRTNEWQLLTFTVNTDGLDGKDWKAAMVSLLTWYTPAKAGQELAWIEWAGAFASVSDAEAYYVENGGTFPDPVPISDPNFVDFRTEDAYNAAMESGKVTLGNAKNGKLSYDKDGGLKLTFTNGAPVNDTRRGETTLDIVPMNDVLVKDKKIVVAKVKADTYGHAQGFLGYGDGVWVGGKKISSVAAESLGVSNHPYQLGQPYVLDAGNGWMYVAYNNEAAVANVGDEAKWEKFTIHGQGVSYQTNESITVAWVGAFDSLEAAKEWDPDYAAPVDIPGKAETFFIDFTSTRDFLTKGQWGNYRIGGEGVLCKNTFALANPNTTVPMYDLEAKALRLVKAEGYTANNFGFTFGKRNAAQVAGGENVTDYPVLALKVKMSPKAIPNGVLQNSGGSPMWVGTGSGMPTSYTGDWQLILINATSQTKIEGDDSWKGINAILGKNAADFEEGETYGYVAWAGAFKTAADAEAYYLSNTEVTNPLIADFRTEEQYDAAVETGKLTLTGDAANGVLSYGDGAAKVTYLNGKPVTEGTRRGETGINILANNQVLVSAGKIVVAKVKANTYGNADGFLGYGDKVWAGSTQIGSGTAVGNGNHPYATKFDWAMDAGNGWTYVAYNTEASLEGVAAGSAWERFFIQGQGVSYQQNESLQIAWVGAFDSLEAAKEWDPDYVAPATGKAGTFFIDFTNTRDFLTKGQWGDYRVGGEGVVFENTFNVTNGNTSVPKYNLEVGALELVKAEGYTASNFGFTFGKRNAAQVAGGDNVADYPILALKVKMSPKALPNGVLQNSGGSPMWVGTGSGMPANYTGNWQLILINATSQSKIEGDDSWKGINAILGKNATDFAEGETYGYVAWAGAFKTAADAEAYYLQTTDVVEIDENLFVDFRTEEAYNTAVNTGKATFGGDARNGVISYSKEGALKLTYLNGVPVNATRRGEGALNIKPINTIKVTDGKIVVAKVKANVGTYADGFLGYSDNVVAGGITISSGTAVGNGNHPYATKFDWAMDAGNGWTYVAYNTEASVADLAADAVWESMRIWGQGVSYQQNESIQIAWVGAFDSLEAAKAWDPDYKDVTVNKSSKLFVDFTSTGDYIAKSQWGVWRISGEGTAYEDVFALASRDSGLSYDLEEGALKLVKKADYTANNFGFALSRQNANDLAELMADYPIVAVKVKMNTKATPNAVMYAKNNGYGWTGIAGMPASYTGDWQLIIASADEYGTAIDGDLTWKGINIGLGKNAGDFEVGETYGHVAWAGAFASVEDAQAYYNMTDPNYVHEHAYDAPCDTECDCGEIRESFIDHKYDNACDTTCNACGTVREIEHTYDNACDADCNVCGATREVADHVYDNACDADCNECGATREVGDHTYGDWVVDTEPTTEAEGSKHQSCTICGHTVTESIPKLDVHEHTWDEGKVTTEATKDTTGVMTYTCTGCGETKTEVIPQTLRFQTASLTLESSVQVNFLVQKAVFDAYGYTDAYAVFEIEERTGNVK